MVRPQRKRKAARRRNSPTLDDQTKKFYKDRKGKIHCMTPKTMYSLRFLRGEYLEEMKEEDYTPAMKVLYVSKDSGSVKKKT